MKKEGGTENEKQQQPNWVCAASLISLSLSVRPHTCTSLLISGGAIMVSRYMYSTLVGDRPASLVEQ